MAAITIQTDDELKAKLDTVLSQQEQILETLTVIVAALKGQNKMAVTHDG